MSNYDTIVKVEDGKLHAKTTFYDDESLNQNDRIRNSGMLDKAKLGVHQDEDVRMAISCPSVVQWNTFKKKNSATYKLLMSCNETERMRGAKQVQILHPDWVVYERL